MPEASDEQQTLPSPEGRDCIGESGVQPAALLQRFISECDESLWSICRMPVENDPDFDRGYECGYESGMEQAEKILRSILQVSHEAEHDAAG